MLIYYNICDAYIYVLYIICCHTSGTSSTIANGTVRVLTTPAVSSIQMNKVNIGSDYFRDIRVGASKFSLQIVFRITNNFLQIKIDSRKSLH